MSISYALLGFLSWRPHTGYDLKKLLSDSLSFYWTGNNAQIYRSLTDLHREELVTQEVQIQDKYPPRKVYTITDKGRHALRAWVTMPPELPQVRNTFLVQLAWTDQLEAGELDQLVRGYEHELEMQVLMRREMQKRGTVSPGRTEREAFVWRMLEENGITALEAELAWAGRLRAGLRDPGAALQKADTHEI
jgi:PadR family transcriptional regulator, regulatory protein AphA